MRRILFVLDVDAVTQNEPHTCLPSPRVHTPCTRYDNVNTKKNAKTALRFFPANHLYIRTYTSMWKHGWDEITRKVMWIIPVETSFSDRNLRLRPPKNSPNNARQCYFHSNCFSRDLHFTSSCTQTQHTTGTGRHTCWGVEDGSLVITTSGSYQNWLGEFGIKGHACPETWRRLWEVLRRISQSTNGIEPWPHPLHTFPSTRPQYSPSFLRVSMKIF